MHPEGTPLPALQPAAEASQPRPPYQANPPAVMESSQGRWPMGELHTYFPSASLWSSSQTAAVTPKEAFLPKRPPPPEEKNLGIRDTAQSILAPH